MQAFARIPLALSVAALSAWIAVGAAHAAPVTVNLRVEGSTKTLYEGPISTEGETIETKSSGGPHPCDYAGNGHFENAKHEVFTNGGTPSGTPTTALRDAALSAGLEFDATWFTNLGDYQVTQVGLDKELTEEPFDAWGYAVNDTTAPVGGCQIALAPGNEVLWAYNYFNLKHLLALSGPATANVGSPITVHVVDGQTGVPVVGAAIGEDTAGVTAAIPNSPLTNTSGTAIVSLAHPGDVRLKAIQSESVRSNGVEVCVHNGNDGTCGTVLPGSPQPVPVTPLPALVYSVRAGGVRNGHHYRPGHGPRLLTGTVRVPTGGSLRELRIGLQRRNGRRCQVFSGARETFVRSRCGTARFFSVGSSESFSYLLPSALPVGRYVYEIEAVDDSGHTTPLIDGTSRVVFYVK